MMTSNSDIEQVFSWALQLSAQQDYQALSHHFLDILLKISGIQTAVAYELHKQEHKRIGNACTTQEHLVVRFPLDFTRESSERHNNLLDQVDLSVDIHTSDVNDNGHYDWAVLSVRDSHGPDRACLLRVIFAGKLLIC